MTEITVSAPATARARALDAREKAKLLAAASPGELVCYHTGFLSVTREAKTPWGRAVNDLALLAASLAGQGYGTLYQQRLPDGQGFSYFYRAGKTG